MNSVIASNDQIFGPIDNIPNTEDYIVVMTEFWFDYRKHIIRAIYLYSKLEVILPRTRSYLF